MKMKNNNFKSILLIFIIVLSLVFLTSTYYTNTNKFFEEIRKDDGYYGFALQRELEDFINNGCGNDTMLDTLTRLCWDKNLSRAGTLSLTINNTYNLPIWNDTNKVYLYPVGRLKSDYPAFSYCEDLDLGGNSDWRLPSPNEFLTLINETGAVGSTCITLNNFGFTNCQDVNYLTEIPLTPNPSYGISIYLSTGNIHTCWKNLQYLVECVRTDY